MIRPVAILLAWASLAIRASAQDRYVDPVAGNDAANGLTPANAWRTISWASANTPAHSGYTLHVLPGTVSAASGETFPIDLRGQRLVGDAGPAATVLQGPPGPNPVIALYTDVGAGDHSSPEVRGFTIRNPDMHGISLRANGFPLTAVLRDLVLEDVGQAGTAAIFCGQVGAHPAVNLTLDHVVARRAQVGLWVFGNPGGGAITVDAQDCAFVDGFQRGMLVEQVTPASTMSFRRCRFGRNANQGVSSYGWAGSSITFEDCSFVRNGMDGLDHTPTSVGVSSVVLERCTFGSNLAVGLRSLDGFPPLGASISLRGCVLYGNADDVAADTIASAAFNDVGDGDFAGSNGNFSADPLFVDALGGDFRLRFGSPCIDRGDPAVTGGLDLSGEARVLDGDLDTAARVDVGALEHRTLDLTSTGALGAPLRLEITGASGAATVVHFSRTGLAAPQSTPFGALELPPGYGQLFASAIPASGVLVFQRPIPPNPLLVGRTFGFQALTASASAPQGQAWSSAEAVTIH